MTAVHRRSHILCSICGVPAFYDRHNQKAWSDPLSELHYCLLGCNHDCMISLPYFLTRLTDAKGMGFTTDWKPLIACRFLLGVSEAAYFPGVVYLLSTWYVRCKFWYAAAVCGDSADSSR